MKEKCLYQISQIPDNERVLIISEGLHRIASHVETLNKTLSVLSNKENRRGYSILRQTCEEEAAKYLILIDYLRHSRRNIDSKHKFIEYFYNHFVRLLYADYYYTSPATWGEVKDYIEQQRPSLYLDGPMRIEWIFRNELLLKREQKIYVDYVEMDGNHRWIGPDEIEIYDTGEWEIKSNIINLVLAMEEICISDPHSLFTIESEWSSFILKDNTHWQDILKMNRLVINKIMTKVKKINNKMIKSTKLVNDNWSFPLINVDLKMKKIKENELKEIQNNWWPE